MADPLMPMRDLPIELLFRLLPSNPELAALRDGVLAGSITDPARRWGGSAAFATLDKRVVPADALDAIFAAAEAKTVAYVRALHESLRAAVAGLNADDHDAVLQQLTDLGEAARTEGAWSNCVDWFTIVLSLAEEWRDSERAILAARRIGLAHLHLGNVAEARRAYERSLSEAEMTNSREGAVVACIGLGHLLGVQGRWQDAESKYLRALELCDEADNQLMGQIKSNLSMTCRERGDLESAAAWLDRARIHWDALSRDDRSVWYNSEGMLLLEAGGLTSARTAFEHALAHSGSYFDTAMILDNLADLSIRENDLQRAENYARRAEEFAIAGNAQRALAEIYIRLAQITRLRGEENGIGFLEKSIELSRAHAYPLAQARALEEYAVLRDAMLDPEAARTLREEAAAIIEALARDS